MLMINDDIADVIRRAQKYPVISRVGVFGSYMRGEQTADSDIDILFDYDKASENDEDYILDILDYGDELSKEFAKMNLQHDYVSYKGVVNSGNNKMRDNILSEVTWVYER